MGIIGWWAGDGDGRDLSGNGFNGTLVNGANYAVGKVGQSFNYKVGGVSNAASLQVPDNALLKPTQFTIEAWVNFNPVFNNYHVAIAKGYATGFLDSYALGTFSSSTMANSSRPQFFTEHQTGSHLLQAPSNLTDATVWNHLAASYDGITKRLYVNGVLVASAVVNQPISYDPSPAPLTVGSDFENSQSYYFFNGQVDEATLYNRALSDMEIAAIFNAGIGGKIKSAPTVTGANSETQVNDAVITFQNVTAAGTTTDYTIDPATAGTLPAGFTQTGLAYDISTTAAYTGAINLCFHIPSVNDATEFSRLKVFHSEGGTLVDKTTSFVYSTRLVCGSVQSLSPFVIANELAPTAATVSVGGRVFAGKQAVSRAIITLTDLNGTARKTITNPFGFYRFEGVEVGQTYILSASHKQYQFAWQVVTIMEETSELDFTAEP